MSLKILMPALSPTMSEGNLTKWLVKEGDTVKPGDILAEIETDKATMEIEAVDEGVVEKLLFEEGDQSIAVNAPIAILADGKNNFSKVENANKNPDSKLEKQNNSEEIVNNEK